MENNIYDLAILGAGPGQEAVLQSMPQEQS